MKHVFYTFLLGFAAVPFFAGIFVGVAGAEPLPEPIEIDPSYNDCFRMAQDALKAEQLGVEMQVDVTQGADPMDVPAETPETRQRKEQTYSLYPGLRGDMDFETALRESGAEIIVDPENPGAAPRVELGGVPREGVVPQPEETEEATEEDTPAPEPTAAEVYKLKKDVCRIKYGISF